MLEEVEREMADLAHSMQHIAGDIFKIAKKAMAEANLKVQQIGLLAQQAKGLKETVDKIRSDEDE